MPLAKSLVEIVEPLEESRRSLPTLSQPGVFEDPAVTALVKDDRRATCAGTIDRSLLTPGLRRHARRKPAATRTRRMLRPLGNLEQALFNESTTVGTVTSDVYTLDL